MEFIGNVLSILAGALMFKLTELLAEHYKKQVLSFFIFIAWLVFLALVFLFVTAIITFIGSGPAGYALVIIIPAGTFIFRIVLTIIEWLKRARSEAE